MDSLVLAEDDLPQFIFKGMKFLRVGRRYGPGGDLRRPRHDPFDFPRPHNPLPLRGDKFQCGPGLIDHIDRLIGQMLVMHIFIREFGRGFQRLLRIDDLMELFIGRLQAAQDGNSLTRSSQTWQASCFAQARQRLRSTTTVPTLA